MRILAILFMFLVATQTFAAEEPQEHRLVGKFKLATGIYKKIAPEGLFFMIVNEKGEDLAFPVSFEKASERENILKSLDKTYLIDGSRAELAVVNGNEEVVQRVHVLKIRSSREVALSELRPKMANVAEPMQKAVTKNEAGVSSPSLSGLNDTVTNAAIFTAGAALLGSILLK